MTSYLKILPLFMMVMPGMISRILFPGKCCRRDLFPLPVTDDGDCSVELLLTPPCLFQIWWLVQTRKFVEKSVATHLAVLISLTLSWS